MRRIVMCSTGRRLATIRTSGEPVTALLFSMDSELLWNSLEITSRLHASTVGESHCVQFRPTGRLISRPSFRPMKNINQTLPFPSVALLNRCPNAPFAAVLTLRQASGQRAGQNVACRRNVSR